MTAYRRISACRICGSKHLEPVLDLGEQTLTGVFPRAAGADPTRGPLRLVKCATSEHACGLVQLEHTYDASEMYGENYGYRSGLNASMVRHLQAKVRRILDILTVGAGDLVLDIGSNDGTTLSAYPQSGATLVGIDPTGLKFKRYYPEHVQLVPEFFSVGTLAANFPQRQAKVITSFSMFYDLESPLQFMREIREALAQDGIWVFEQSYLPSMLESNSYDTVCHEHLEYYALKQIHWMARRAGLKLLDVEFNDVNGGSFSVLAARAESKRQPSGTIERVLQEEGAKELDSLAPYEAFRVRVRESRAALRDFLVNVRQRGERVCALGASTKGNVILQYCGVTPEQIESVGEVNEEKFGRYTPGTRLPILAEDEVLASAPDYLLVLPWHFRKFFATNRRFAGRKLVFPLPTLEVVSVPA